MGRNNLVRRDNLKPQYIDFNDVWVTYRDKNKHKSMRTKITNRAQFLRVVKDCLRTISYLWVNSTGGVYVSGLGYMTVYRPPKKKNSFNNPDSIASILRTHGYTYYLTHMPDLKKGDSFHGFSLRRRLDKLRYGARDNIISGRRYTTHSPLIKEYIKKKRTV